MVQHSYDPPSADLADLYDSIDALIAEWRQEPGWPNGTANIGLLAIDVVRAMREDAECARFRLGFDPDQELRSLAGRAARRDGPAWEYQA